MNTLDLAQALAVRPPDEAAELIENVFDQFRAIVPHPQWDSYAIELMAVGISTQQACQRPLPPPKPPIQIT